MKRENTEYDPFEPLMIWDGGYGSYVDSEPMSDYDWEEWLEVESYADTE